MLQRAASAGQAPDYRLMAYVIQSTYILLAPTLMTASIYMMLGRIVRLTEGEAHSVISSSKITKVFVTGDVVCLLAQSGGENPNDGGTKITPKCSITDHRSRRWFIRRRPSDRHENRHRRPGATDSRVPHFRRDRCILQPPHQQSAHGKVYERDNGLAPAHESNLHQLRVDFPALGGQTCRIRARVRGLHLHARVVLVRTGLRADDGCWTDVCVGAPQRD